MKWRLCVLLFIIPFPFLQAQIATEDFFPFGVENGDSTMAPLYWSNYNEIQIMDGIQFPYFNRTFKSVFLFNGGVISFTAAFQNYVDLFYLCRNDNPSFTNIPMIFPFASHVDVSDGGNVFYRQTRNTHLLIKAANDIQMAFPTTRGLNLNWMFIATWDQVPSTFSSLQDKYCGDFSSRNTFQAVLATDGIQSYGIFYYNNIVWTAKRSMSVYSETCSSDRQAGVGFQSGYADSVYRVQGSCGASIKDVATKSNVNQEGKWVFRFDTNQDPCDENLINSFHISPSLTPMLGHIQLTLTGACLNSAVQAECTFFSAYLPESPSTPLTTVPATILSDKSAAMCQVPYLYANGRFNVRLNVTNEDNSSQEYNKYIYAADNDFQDDLLSFRLNQAYTVSLTWDPELLGDVNTLLELNLIEFSGGLWTPRGVLKAGLQNSGEYDGAFDDITPIINLESFFVAQLKSPEVVGHSKYIFSPFQYTDLNKTGQYFDQRCDSWYANDAGPPLFILPCPPLLTQAMSDTRFERLAEDTLRYFHPKAEHGFRQRVPSIHRSGQQCVYKDGFLLLDSISGGRPQLTSPNARGGLAYHWRDDILPYFWCCLFSTSTVPCNKFNRKRPSDSGQTYDRPSIGNGNGDPHITTFDLFNYTFNGVGEYWMIKGVNDSFLMQARMEQYFNDDTPTQASIFTAFVIQQTLPSDNTTATIEDPLHVQVSVNIFGTEVSLYREVIELPSEMRESPFTISDNGVSVTFLSSKEVSIAFSSGFSFEFSTSDNIALNIVASASIIANGTTAGLLGVFDGNSDNDLTTPDDQIIDPDSSMETIHTDFGSQWRTTEANSLFIYPKGKTHTDYQNPDFIPIFVPDLSNIPTEVKEMCGESFECLFDFATTGNVDMANGTKEFIQVFEETVELIEEKVKMCNQIEEVINGEFEIDKYFEGGAARFWCDDGYKLQGDDTIQCTITPDTEEISWHGKVPICISLQDSTTIPPPTSPSTITSYTTTQITRSPTTTRRTLPPGWGSLASIPQTSAATLLTSIIALAMLFFCDP